jgi:hypothetical protein
MEEAENGYRDVANPVLSIFLLMTYSYRSTCYLFHASPPPLAGSG